MPRCIQLSTTLACLLSITCYAGDLDIKGIRIGMKREEVVSIIRAANLAGGFTINNATPPMKFMNGLVTVDKYDQAGNLVLFMAMFKPTDFARIESAMMAKYPSTTCIDSTVQNAYGATFPQRQCIHTSGTERMLARRLSSTRDLGDISLTDSAIQQGEPMKNDL